MNRATFTLAAAMTLVPASAFAQDAEFLESHHRQERLESPTNESQAGLSKPAITIIGSSGDTDVALTIGINPHRAIRNGRQSFGSITLKAPLYKDEGQGSFLTQQGIPNKVGVEAGYTWVLGAPGTVVVRDIAPVDTKFLERCRTAVINSPEYQAIAQDPNSAPRDAAQKQRAHLETACQTGTSIWQRDLELLERHLDPADLQAASRALDKWRDSTVTVINLAGGAGYKKFDYLDPVGFGELSADRTSYFASASLGFSFSARSPFVGLGYQYRRDYEPADKRVICPPPTAPGANVECKNSAFDAPKRDVDHTAFGLVRVANLFGDARWFTAPIVEVKAAYDFEDDVFSASVPIYFLLDKAGDFKGGIRIGWQNKVPSPDQDKLRFSFFIVKSFDFMGL